jgi:hypothetical protein
MSMWIPTFDTETFLTVYVVGGGCQEDEEWREEEERITYTALSEMPTPATAVDQLR